MKTYIIEPPFKMFGREDDRTSAAIDVVAEMVFECLRRGGDTFQYAIEWADPGKGPDEPCHSDTAVARVVELSSDEALRDWLRKSVDANKIGGGTVRSIMTCRCVTFGYDGQALLCLRHDDEPPASPNPELAEVEERSDLLADTDYFDGWVRD